MGEVAEEEILSFCSCVFRCAGRRAGSDASVGAQSFGVGIWEGGYGIRARWEVVVRMMGMHVREKERW